MELLQFVLHISNIPTVHGRIKRENSKIYLKMIIFKERNRRTQQILVIFYSFNGRRDCSIRWVEGEEKKNVPDDFMVPLQIFLYVLLFEKHSLGVFVQEGFPHSFPTHTRATVALACSCEDENSSPLHKSIHPLLFLCFCFFIICFTTE